MRPTATVLALTLLAVLGLTGCGREAEEDRVRATLERFAGAVAAKDYETVCDDLFAEELLVELRQIDLPCELALQRGFSQVQRPTLSVRRLRVRDDRAEALVRTDAANQPSSEDTVRLIRRGEEWRIVSLDS